jgi:type I restriction enzyme S subunit
MSGMEQAKTAARRAQERLQHYRTAVLHTAVTGELTRDWREARGLDESGKTENGNALLHRFLDLRRTRWEEAELARLRRKGREPKDEQWKSLYIEPVLPDNINFPKLPEEWAWASIDMIGEIGSGISVSKNRVVENPVELPYLRVANVLRGYLDLTEVKTIRVQKERVAEYLLEEGDILFNEGGDRDKLGRGWVWEGQIPKCIHQNHVFRVRLIDRSLLDPRLVSHWGNTFGQQFFLIHGIQTTNLASINRAVLSRLPVPIPPLSEQSQIINEVERRLAAAGRLSTTLDNQIERVRATRESLLREAFAGRLVPQNPNDEPAAILLDRIRAIRTTERESRKMQKKSHSRKQSVTSPAMQLIDIIKHHYGNRAFTFDSLRKDVREYDYENLKNELFALLRPTEVNGIPALQMSFDAKKETMEFKLKEL